MDFSDECNTYAHETTKFSYSIFRSWSHGSTCELLKHNKQPKTTQCRVVLVLGLSNTRDKAFEEGIKTVISRCPRVKIWCILSLLSADILAKSTRLVRSSSESVLERI